MKLASFALLVFVLPATLPTPAPAVMKTIEMTETDLRAAHEALSEQRERIARERSEWSQRLEALQEEVRDLRQRAQSAQDMAAQHETAHAGQKRRKSSQDAEFRALSASITEFHRASQARMSAVQLQRHHVLLERIDTYVADDEAAGFQLSAIIPTLELLTAIMLHDTPSQPFPGVALDAEGRVHEGRFIRAGPLSFFADNAGRTAGYVITDSSGTEPLAVALPDARAETAVRSWIVGATAMVPLDASGGGLHKLTHARRSLTERIRQGGVIMIPLLLIGLAALGMTLSRYIALQRMNIDINPELTRILARIDAGDEPGARQTAETIRQPWREILTDAIDHWKADRAYLEEILQDRIAMQTPHVTQYLTALSICAAAAPLLGLLGTVTGMIHTFQLITVFGTGDARTLSGGISEALITTQFGLIIAVPALLAQAYLARKAKGIVSGLEQAAIRLIRHAPEVQEKTRTME